MMKFNSKWVIIQNSKNNTIVHKSLILMLSVIHFATLLRLIVTCSMPKTQVSVTCVLPFCVLIVHFCRSWCPLSFQR